VLTATFASTISTTCSYIPNYSTSSQHFTHKTKITKTIPSTPTQPKTTKIFLITTTKTPKIQIHLVVPAATSYPCTYRIAAVGDPWTLEIGGLGGGFRGFRVLGEPQIADEDVRMFGGGPAMLVWIRIWIGIQR
jgi:hypothetical protein